LKTKLTIALLLSAISFCTLKSQTINPYYQGIVANVSYDSIYHYLHKFETLGVKESGTTAINNTKDWLLAKYAAYGYTDIKIDTFTYSGHSLYNIVVTKTGTLYPNKYVIVDGHYDTKTGTGTNDNGSGVSVILEIARLLKNISTEYSVRFINFSAEEPGLIGSNHYVTNVVAAQNMQIRLVFNIDEVGGIAGMVNNTVRCESDQSSPSSNNATSAAFTDTLTILTQLYSTLNTTITNAYGSDYVPFQQNGEIITGYYEDNESTYPHTSNDLLSNLDTSYVYQMAKAATGATLYFARAFDVSVGTIENENVPEGINVFPNPFGDNIFIRNSNPSDSFCFRLYDSEGQLIFEKNSATDISVDMRSLKSSIYFYFIKNKNGEQIKSGKLVKSY